MGYFLGYQPIGISILDSLYQEQGYGTMTYGDILGSLAESILDPNGPLIALGIGALAAVAITLVAGFSTMYILPLLMLVAVLNLLVFPLSFLLEPSLPAELAVPFKVFFNILTVLVIVNFVRGGSV